jgi:GGDEF domain-containing protein
MMAKDRNKQQLEELVELLKWNAELGCYTRQAFEHLIWPEIKDEATWMIVFDVDGMKALNGSFGWAYTSGIIKRSIVMRSTDHVAGQLLSGDEFAVVVTESPDREPTNPWELCERIFNNFKANGASATFAYGRVTSDNFEENSERINAIVQAAKRENRRGTITQVTEVDNQ